MSKLEKSAETRRKEQEIQKLRLAIKKKRTTVKRLRTRLNNTKTDIVDMQRTLAGTLFSMNERIATIRKKMTGLLKKLRDRPFLDDQQVEAVDRLLDDISEAMPDLGEEYMAQMKEKVEQYDDGERAEEQDPFETFRKEPEAEEKRDLRKLYLRLSQAFHPDRAKTKKESTLHHDMMQRIVEAYRRHDVETLLALEQEYLQKAELNLAAVHSTDVLDNELDRLRRELNFLQQQAGRLSAEIKALRKSELGQALTEYDSSKRYGYSLEEQSAILDRELAYFEQFKIDIETALRKDRMTPELEEHLAPVQPDNLLEEMMEDLFGDIFEEEEGGYYGEPLPSFHAGQLVEWTPAPHSFLRQFGLRSRFRGVVQGGYFDAAANHFIYSLAVGPEIIDRLNEDILDYWIDHYLEQPYLEAAEPELKAVSGKKPDIQKGVARGRERLYEYLLEDFDPDRRRRLKATLLADPAASDGANWMAFFRKRPLRSSIPVSIRPNEFMHLNRRSGKLEGITEYDDDDGVITSVRCGKRSLLCPLYLLNAKKDEWWTQALDDYRAWAKYRLPAL